MPDYVRANVPVGSYFFTVALLERRPRVLSENIEVLYEAFRSVRDRTPFLLDAFVIFPITSIAFGRYHQTIRIFNPLADQLVIRA
jgi:hypothetical protein